MKYFAFVILAAVFAAPLSAAAEESPAASKPDIKKGESISSNLCVACHANDGSRGIPANPILQGQHFEYLFKQLVDFKEGQRDAAPMKDIAKNLSEEDMRNVAYFYSTKQAKLGAAKNKDFAELGQKIYRGGVLDKSIPACAGCHGASGAGIPAQYPKIAGQNTDYIAAQLKKFRLDTRKNSAPMTAIAQKMSDKEIDAVSDYISGLH